MKIGNLHVAMADDFDEMRVLYEHWNTESDGSTWCTRCVVWMALDHEGNMFQMRRTPTVLPPAMNAELSVHRDKLKTILLLSRK